MLLLRTARPNSRGASSLRACRCQRAAPPRPLLARPELRRPGLAWCSSDVRATAALVRDSSNDNIAEKGDRTRLCVWQTITDAELEGVFGSTSSSSSSSSSSVSSARRSSKIDDAEPRSGASRGPNGGRRCRKSCRTASLTPARSSSGSTARIPRLPEPRPSRCRGTAAAAPSQLGIPCWIAREESGAASYAAGHRDSDVFLLVLSRTCWEVIPAARSAGGHSKEQEGADPSGGGRELLSV